METKSVKEAWHKVASLLSLSEGERLKYLSELSERQLSELQRSLNVVSGDVEKRLRKEATWTNQLKERLEKEGWQVTHFAPDKQRGPDLEAVKKKAKGKRTIIMEIKGEPVSAKSASGQRVHYVGEALLSILKRMGTQSSDTRSGDVRYCIVFLDTYLPVVKPRLHTWVREKLDLYILFLKGGSVKALYPAGEHLKDLRSFDELFEK